MNSVEQRSARSGDGTSIAWYDFGGNGPDLLLAHATGFCGLIWQPVAELLKPNFRCVAYDVRGHGNSGRPDYGRDGWDWNRYADDARSVIIDGALDRPYGVGHSSGGATEILVEETAPGSFRALYLFEPVIFTDEPPAGPMPERDLAVNTRRRRRTFASRSAALENFESKGPFRTLAPAALVSYVDNGFGTQTDGTLEIKCDPDDEAEVYVMASAHDGYSKLASIACPAVVAYGSQSTSFTATEMQAVASRIPAGKLERFDDLGHFGPLEDPERFVAAVLKAFAAG